jgi:hypothetical protein
MAIIKHVGKHNNKKVVVVFRQVPNESSAGLIVYTDEVPSVVHNDIMRVLESPEGQAAGELAEVFNRNLSSDGKNLLNSLHLAGYMKKVPTNQVILTPNAASTIRLDELNTLLDQIAAGNKDKLSEADRNAGMVTRQKETRTTSGSITGDEYQPVTAPANGVLSDADIAKNNLGQAAQLRKNASALIAEASRLEEEAKQFLPKTEDASEKTTEAA